MCHTQGEPALPRPYSSPLHPRSVTPGTTQGQTLNPILSRADGTPSLTFKLLQFNNHFSYINYRRMYLSN